jgi:tetratricopeptide (TPR) repeat protein
MAKDKKNKDPADALARYVSSEEDKAKAKRFFVRAGQLFESKSWDFAIKCYVEGLGYWPEAVEEGHQLLRLAACERNVRGGKKPGFGETMKHSMTGRDAKKAMLNATWLLAHDPFNISYMEGILKNAHKLRCEEVVMWIGPIYGNAIEGEKKLNPKRFALLREIYEETGDRATDRGEAPFAGECYERAAAALRVQTQVDPKDLSLVNELRDLSTKLTILKGKYDTEGGFQDSVRDADEQKHLQDQERMIQTDTDLLGLIKRAEKDLADNPDNAGKVDVLVDLLCKRDDPEQERRAISLLVEKYNTYHDYRFKVRAEDVRIKQLKRAYREARAANDAELAKKKRSDLLTFELRAFRDRIKQYPTDNRLKFEYASRLFQIKKFDDAIPSFQAARADPKVRTRCDLALGRCFYEKGFHAQAIGTLSKAVENYEFSDDSVGKDLRYWLARSLEADGKIDEAQDVYGQVLQLDYNYRDVRDRLERLN